MNQILWVTASVVAGLCMGAGLYGIVYVNVPLGLACVATGLTLSKLASLTWRSDESS